MIDGMGKMQDLKEMSRMPTRSVGKREDEEELNLISLLCLDKRCLDGTGRNWLWDTLNLRYIRLLENSVAMK